MAAVWVMGTRLDWDEFGNLVRADLIGQLSGSTQEVSASRIGCGTKVMLAHKESIGLSAPAPELPENFHLALLVKIGEAREQALGSMDDLIILADLDDNTEWDWSILPAKELLAP